MWNKLEKLIGPLLLILICAGAFLIIVLLRSNSGNRQVIVLLEYENRELRKRRDELVDMQLTLGFEPFERLNRWATIMRTIDYKPKSITFVGPSKLRTFNMNFPLESTDGFIGSQTFYWLLESSTNSTTQQK